MTTLVATGAARRVALLAALVALVATVAFWVTPASAAHLTVTHARIATFTASACTTQSIGFTAPSASSAQTSVTVTGIPATCAGKTGRAVLANSQGGKVADLTWTMASGSQTVSVPGFPTANVTGAKLVANGWWVPASWTAPVPTNPTPPDGPVVCYRLDSTGKVVTDAQGNGVRCTTQPTLTTVHVWDEGSASKAWMRVEYRLENSSAQSLLVFDFKHSRYAAFAGDASRTSVTLGGYDGGINLASPSACDARPILRAVVTKPSWGTTSTGFVQLASGTQSGQVCAPR